MNFQRDASAERNESAGTTGQRNLPEPPVLAEIEVLVVGCHGELWVPIPAARHGEQSALGTVGHRNERQFLWRSAV